MHISASHRRVLIAGGALFLLGATLVAGSYVVQGGWRSADVSDVMPLSEECAVHDRAGTLYRYSYYVDGQTYYYDECQLSRADTVETISYDPQDPYTAAITRADTYRVTGFVVAAMGLLVTIGALLLPGKLHS